ncbi:bleomycin resistance protein [Methylovirgula sp. 4M-Z18]|uniref:bleomycin resistance protein n=1 Tax=Methylovirgula sp. 4M-Z18 TaxID=2293567 RepID=UPI000E2F16D8|nr:VOC family protein [Methylovirgula sp. 4M-Z18]RFB76376.1 VOC family protein [Methylovirgula sp. 4M-Z18]
MVDDQTSPSFLASVVRGGSPSNGRAPQAGFAALVPELAVSNIEASLAFWCGPLGFRIAYDRPAGRFAYLERGPLQIMLCERNGRWEVGAMQQPFGRGMSLQMRVDDLEAMIGSLQVANWPIYEGPYDMRYRVGSDETHQREFLVQDPDGYLLRFVERLRPPAAAS